MRNLTILLASLFALSASAADQWVHFPGTGKHVVLMAGDEEYRSEEGLPQLAKILSQRHGFDCTVVFSINPASGEIDPKYPKNTPGLEALDAADLFIILTRFRDLPDDQMKHVDDYLTAGKPVIGLRTATHAFNTSKGTKYERYAWNYDGAEAEWKQGFGRLVLGETWVAHHGSHKNESTRGLIAPHNDGNPLLNGIKDGEIWGPTDVYTVRLPLPGDSVPVVFGQVVVRKGPALKPEEDPFFGMRETDTEAAGPQTDKKGNTTDKNNPMMPVAWTHGFQLPGGKAGKAFATTMGSSSDLTNEALRRLLVNAAYELTGQKTPEKADVAIVGEYKPRAFGFDGFQKGLHPADFQK